MRPFEPASHAPPDYDCPFCRIGRDDFGGPVGSDPRDVLLRTDFVTALISLRQWPGTPGHAVVIPNAHHESLYTLPLSEATAIHEVARALAIAMKRAYGCDGISTRQHNEPAGNQDVWHYHLHVFPRWAGDWLYRSHGRNMPADERAGYAERVREELAGFRAQATRG